MHDMSNELCETFVAECLDYIDELEPQFIELSEAMANGDAATTQRLMNNIFRLVHTIKGSAGSLGLNNIASLAHKAENLLDLVRHKKLTLTAQRLTLLTSCLDIFRSLMAHLQTNQSDDGTDHLIGDAREKFDHSITDEEPDVKTTKAAATEVSSGFFVFDEEESQQEVPTVKITEAMRMAFVQEAEESLHKVELNLLGSQDAADTARHKHFAEALRVLHSFKGNCSFMMLSDMESLVHSMEEALQELDHGQAADDRIDVLLRCVDAMKVCLPAIAQDQPVDSSSLKALRALLSGTEEVKKAVGSAQVVQTKDADKTSSALQKAAPVRSDVRVDIKKLDALINLVGELVVAEAMVSGWSFDKEIEDERLERAVHHLRRTTQNLQDVAMSVRMVPVNQTFKKMIRLVHDTGAKLGKKIRLDLVGEETEVDKTVIEQISDPLVHCVRNSIDHGIENAEERRLTSKNEVGQITLEARHEGGEVWIIIQDDGRGLSREKILNRAREAGLVTRDREAAMTDSEVFNFIFEAGFSTAEKVTDISGRGVGMDVVRKNIEKVKGRVHIESELGRGTRVIFQIPLTLAIIDGMMIRIGEMKYTIPLLTIQESIRIKSEQLTVGPDGLEMIDVRSNFIPIIKMSEQDRRPVERGKEMVVVIVEINKKSFGLLVDEILGQQQTVIKALPSMYKHSSNVSGCSILASGDVSLIIDVAGIAKSLSRQYEFLTQGAA